jgi:hypothetical protein
MNAMFRHALVKEAPTNAVIHGQGVVKVPISSAPLYVLVVVKDPKTGRAGNLHAGQIVTGRRR